MISVSAKSLFRPFRAWTPFRVGHPGLRSFLAAPWAGLARAFGPQTECAYRRDQRHERALWTTWTKPRRRNGSGVTSKLHCLPRMLGHSSGLIEHPRARFSSRVLFQHLHGPVAQRLEQGTHNSKRGFFTVLHGLA
jgi:hypothetical protein